MAIDEAALKSLLHGIVDWIPFTHEEVKNEFHTLVEDLDGSVSLSSFLRVPATETATAGETVTATTPVASAPTVAENADAVAQALAPSLNAIATALGNLAPKSGTETSAPEGVPS